ncbi:thiamine phosphate synthase [Sphingobacterium wenxiniae]|uniref:Thiamine-phosphate diphosphorylase n=1 Tax=Sphingobacterium wenxiniae TaxID=683125 RepID=A0A1I6SQA8_9SPHI|nr:thiamine phosphate synthase [Sphingobacterium wenxiniae]SFS79096.1 thiamine-phosphate diphosphorylase [Sphingobacterium wenxiniae]
MIRKLQDIGSGIYIVIDPSMERSVLYSKIERILTEKIAAVQIWDNFDQEDDIDSLIDELCLRCHAKGVPVLINNQWQYLRSTMLDGVHFDVVPLYYEQLQEEINRSFLCGITCSNDMDNILWARDHKVDYISFCSMFPSKTVESCELVNHNSVRKAREIFEGPIFLAGGINPDNIGELRNLPYTGIAVISGVMNSDTPDQSIREYLKNGC